jgi:hypothetical protein
MAGTATGRPDLVAPGDWVTVTPVDISELMSTPDSAGGFAATAANTPMEIRAPDPMVADNT